MYLQILQQKSLYILDTYFCFVQATVSHPHSCCWRWSRALSALHRPWLVLIISDCGAQRPSLPRLRLPWSHGCLRCWPWALLAKRFTPAVATAPRGWYAASNRIRHSLLFSWVAALPFDADLYSINPIAQQHQLTQESRPWHGSMYSVHWSS